MSKAATDFIERSTRSYRHTLEDQLSASGTPAADPEELGRRAALSVTSGQEWAELIGPFYDSAGASTALGGISKQAVSQRVSGGSLLGLRLASDGSARERLVYPAWQFHSTILRHLSRVLSVAGFDPDRPTTGWTIASWLTTPEESLSDMTPVQMLRAGHVDLVCDAAAVVGDSLGSNERRSARIARRARARDASDVAA